MLARLNKRIDMLEKKVEELESVLFSYYDSFPIYVSFDRFDIDHMQGLVVISCAGDEVRSRHLKDITSEHTVLSVKWNLSKRDRFVIIFGDKEQADRYVRERADHYFCKNHDTKESSFSACSFPSETHAWVGNDTW